MLHSLQKTLDRRSRASPEQHLPGEEQYTLQGQNRAKTGHGERPPLTQLPNHTVVQAIGKTLPSRGLGCMSVPSR